MKTVLLLAALLLAVPLAVADDGRAEVTLLINLGHAVAPAYKTCDVTVAEGATVAAVLDRAVETGCISSWESSSFPGFGRYVTCVDGICETPATYWAFYVGGEYAVTGIDATPARDGETYQFTYEQWAVQLPL